MEEQYYQIREVSKITGISKDTLHFYTKAGLVTPDYIDPENHYRYYSRWNMYQLDILMTCRNLGIPLERVRQIISSRDNEKVVALLMEYREEALRLSRYYQQVADDIVWYRDENEHIQSQNPESPVRVEEYAEEIVIAGGLNGKDTSYHANLQEVLKQEFQNTHFVRRKYGYVLDTEAVLENRLQKCREYVKLPDGDYSGIAKEHLYTMPAGKYAVFTLRIQDEQADFTPLLQWMKENHCTTDLIFADEAGFQLFQYIYDYCCEVRAHLISL